MSLLYVECNMGAAGDMLAAALYELCTDAQKHTFSHAMQLLAPHGVRVAPQHVMVCGISATHMAVTVHGCEEKEPMHAHAQCDIPASEHTSTHSHPHAVHHAPSDHSPHAHTHSHAAPAQIAALLDSLSLPTPVCEMAKAVYARIAQAESHAHGVPVTEIHFHEVGALDAVADVTAVCLLLHLLAPDSVTVSPIATGSGTVRCAHGVLPVPAPATAYLLEGAPIWAGPEHGELCTPTGAALLRQMASAFGSMPLMVVEKIGCGAGTKQFSTANVVRAFWGKPMVAAPAPNDNVTALCCNLDDATAEEMGYAQHALLSAGALDAYTTPIGMKKNRPGTLFTVLCRTADADRLAALLLQETPTLGVRRTDHPRYALVRDCVTVDTPYGSIRVKTAQGYGASKAKPEYDDVAAAAARTHTAFAQVHAAAMTAFSTQTAHGNP